MKSPTPQTESVSFCRSRLPLALANQFKGLGRNLRGRTVAWIILAHTKGVDIEKMNKSADELHRVGVLLNQSLKVSRGKSVDTQALQEAVNLVKGLWP